MAPGSVCTIFCVLVICWVTAEASDEARLFSDLFPAYDKQYGRVLPPVGPVEYQFGFMLVRADLDVDQETVTAAIWLTTGWNDTRLSWDPKKYGDIQHVRVPASMVWKPDLYLYTSAEKMEIEEVNCVVYSSGSVLWIPPAKVKVDCPLETSKTCDSKNSADCANSLGTCVANFKFGSWTFDGNKLDPQFYNKLEDIDTTMYIPRNSLRLVSTSGKKEVKIYDCCEEPYPSMEFKAVFEAL